MDMLRKAVIVSVHEVGFEPGGNKVCGGMDLWKGRFGAKNEQLRE